MGKRRKKSIHDILRYICVYLVLLFNQNLIQSMFQETQNFQTSPHLIANLIYQFTIDTRTHNPYK